MAGTQYRGSEVKDVDQFLKNTDGLESEREKEIGILDLAALTMEASAMAGVPLAGTNYTVGVEDYHHL